MRQTENKVKITGLLSEINLEKGSYNKNGTMMDRISGYVTVRVEQPINGENIIAEIPVYQFANKYKNDGNLNPVYEGLEKIMTSYNSIAAVGEEKADMVQFDIRSDAIRMNEYYNTNGTFVSFPRVHGSFIKKVSRDTKQEATFTTEFYIQSIANEVNFEGIETDRLKITGAIFQYGERLDQIVFYTANENVANAIQSYWNPGDTVRAVGRLNFTTKVETTIESSGFGESIEKNTTINVSELIITGGSEGALEGDFAVDAEEIKRGMADRAIRLEETKTKNSTKSVRPAPSRASGLGDTGF